MATVVRRSTEVFRASRGDKYAYCCACDGEYPDWWHLTGGQADGEAGRVAFAVPLCDECTRLPERAASAQAAVLQAHASHVAACEEMGVQPVGNGAPTPLVYGFPYVSSAATEEERGWQDDYERSVTEHHERYVAWADREAPQLRAWTPPGWERDPAASDLAPVWYRYGRVAQLWIEEAPPWHVALRNGGETWVRYTLLVDGGLVSAGTVHGSGELAETQFGLRGEVEGDLARREVTA